jgi:hypothetical protein
VWHGIRQVKYHTGLPHASAARHQKPLGCLHKPATHANHTPQTARLSRPTMPQVYVDTDDDVRLARRIQRDVTSRGRDVAGVIGQYTKFVKPAFDTFIGPSRCGAAGMTRLAHCMSPRVSHARAAAITSVVLLSGAICSAAQCHPLVLTPARIWELCLPMSP